jgi:hypothetical protein
MGLASPELTQFLGESGLQERQIEVGRASIRAMKKLKEAGLASEVVLAEIDRMENGS